MRVVLCSNAFKECLTSQEACDAMRRGVLQAVPAAQCLLRPLADGGDSSLEVLCGLAGGRVERAEGISDPLGRNIAARYGVANAGRTIVVEMAEASGLRLLSDAEKDPSATSSYGTGELLATALSNHSDTAESAILCIGGSATNDMGIGMAAALGYRFFEASGAEITRPTGGDLQRISRISADGVHRAISEGNIRFAVACDVATPLLGPAGATRTFGPQKGASTEAQLCDLEAGLENLVEVCQRHATSLRASPEGMASWAGGGAAGGMGAGCHVFLGAAVKKGFDVCCEAVGLREALEGADLAITGEGRLDSQTSEGKVPQGVAALCQEAGVPLAIIAGGIDSPAPPLEAAMFSLCRGPMSLQEAMVPEVAAGLISETARNIAYLHAAARGRAGAS